MKAISYLTKAVFCLTAGLALTVVLADTSSAGVAVAIGDPGFFGAISIGNAPQPVFLNSQPVIIQPGPVTAAPLYLRVRPHEQQNWRRYCGRYNACGQPVYFVDHNWYKGTYAPYYKGQRRDYDRRDYGRDYDRRDHGRGHRQDPRDRWDRR